MKKLLFLIALISTTTVVSGSHVAGGEITYEYIGNISFPHRYEITLTLLRDTRGMNIQNPSINYWSSCASTKTISLDLDTTSGQGIYSWTKAQGLTSPYSCVDTTGLDLDLYEVWIYKGVVNLPNPCDDWVFAFSVCCLSGNIDNLSNSSGNTFYIEAFLDNSKGHNNSPEFIDPPFKSFCISSKTLNWNQRGIDSDGDSLYYKFVAPQLNGGSNFVYAPGFNMNNQLSSIPPMQIDSKTGTILLSPTKIENVFVSISIEDYKFNIVTGGYYLAGIVRRYMQIPVSASCALNQEFTISSHSDSANVAVSAQCGSNKLEFYTNAYYNVNTIASDASDFVLYHKNHLIPISGVKVFNAAADNKIEIELRDTVSFNDTLYLQVMIGNDLNTILSDCGDAMSAGDSLMVIFKGCSGIDLTEKARQISKIFPNPSSEIINISYSGFYDKVSIELRDNIGKILIRKSLDPQLNRHSIAISEIPSGVYYLKINFPNFIENHSIIKN